ncbi:MAG TPA: hypothetical protein VFI61_00095 [Patescibacteria group bacterium]|nr:hypothetical protein [Patescibacteria group bacterium]
MSNLLKKLSLSFLSFLILFGALLPNFLVASAAPNPPPPTPGVGAEGSAGGVSPWYNQNFWDWHTKVYSDQNQSEIFGERYTAAQVQWVVYGIGALIVNAGGPDATAALVCIHDTGILTCGDKIKKFVDSINPLTDSSTTNKTALSFFDSQPISGIGYIHQKINNFHLIPEAHAQGVGFDAVNPIQKLWVAFRNLTFGLMVIVVLIMAFMIMFRVKVSPQAVITVQSALPKVALGLILITFSYAIAGLMIDLMYLVMGLLASFISSAGSGISTLNAIDVFKGLNNENILSLSILYFFYYICGIFSIFAGHMTGVTTGILFGIGYVVISFIMTIVIVIVLFISIFKILWLLIKTYAMILIQVVMGPIQILIGTVTPFGGAGAWLKGLAANLAVYPVVSFMYVLSFFFLAQGFSSAFPVSNIPTNLSTSVPVIGGLSNFLTFPFGIKADILKDTSTWTPPMLGASWESWLGFLWLGVSLVIMTLIPKTAEIIQSAISGKPFAFGAAIGEAVGPIGRGSLQYGVQKYEGKQMASFTQQFPAQKYTGSWFGNTLRSMGAIK